MNLSESKIVVDFVRLAREDGNRTDPIAFHATVQTPAGTFSTPWGVGVGHAKGYRQGGYTAYQFQLFQKGIRAYKPIPEDLICHIITFSDTLETTFPEWAENLGMSADSISAKESYETYQQQNIILRNAFGDKWDAMVEYAYEQ